ncbi:uncharacterized protein LOC110914501 [Helianthus annuus]|uniref:uncharacterized protein LOC110914501 n=1 Tax=Helianthus annuus TaxID=4232 RepID=UPI000B8FE4C0|nr:uncharacterized protein LOC110914501 [Helianthus annuus]
MAYDFIGIDTKNRIAALVPFEEGKLPIKYLGVPLLASRLMIKDCKVLVERVVKRINDWKNRFLSFAGRLQLVISVLSSIHVYWASVFILPTSIIKELECKMKWFLWGYDSGSKGRAKVAWKDVCLPKSEGGLGIRRISDVNKSLMAYHIFSLLSGRKSMLTSWIDSYRLRGRSIWDIPVKSNSPWGWKKLMKCRSFFREHFWSKVGNGMTTFLWFDKWAAECPLHHVVTPRQMARFGFSIKSKVADAFRDGRWVWPEAWRSVYPILFQLRPLNLSTLRDKVEWMNSNGKLVPFSSKETHEHLFFECSYSKSVWFKVRCKIGMDSVIESWEDIVSRLISKAASKSVYDVAARLVVAAMAYNIWSERNSRFFSNRLRPPELIADGIISTVRAKLFSFKYKQTPNVMRFLDEWKMGKADLWKED